MSVLEQSKIKLIFKEKNCKINTYLWIESDKIVNRVEYESIKKRVK